MLSLFTDILYMFFLFNSILGERETLTMWNVFVGIEVLIYVHGKVHHVCVAEKIQLPLEKFLLIVDLT